MDLHQALSMLNLTSACSTAYTSHGWIMTVWMCVDVCVCLLEEEQKERLPQALNDHQSEKNSRAMKFLVHTPSLLYRHPVSAMTHNLPVM